MEHIISIFNFEVGDFETFEFLTDYVTPHFRNLRTGEIVESLPFTENHFKSKAIQIEMMQEAIKKNQCYGPSNIL